MLLDLGNEDTWTSLSPGSGRLQSDFYLPSTRLLWEGRGGIMLERKKTLFHKYFRHIQDFGKQTAWMKSSILLKGLARFIDMKPNHSPVFATLSHFVSFLLKQWTSGPATVRSSPLWFRPPFIRHYNRWYVQSSIGVLVGAYKYQTGWSYG